MTLHTFTNLEDQVETYVTEATDGGFRVSMKDLDSGEFLPITYGLKTEAKAIEKAQYLINIG